jgi:predicted acyltransferase
VSVPRVRLDSLDAFRGITIAAMILVNNPGDWDHVYAPLEHAEWNGCTPADLIFPFFLFIAGVALAFSSRSASLRKVWTRAAVLVVIGLALKGYPDFDLSHWRIPGVLQRIGLVLGVAGTLAIVLKPRGQLLACAGLLAGYALLLVLGGDLSPDGNVGARLDRALFGEHLWRGTWDPEGILGTLPVTATALIGLMAGHFIRATTDRSRCARHMLLAGVALLSAGLLASLWLPINKNLWSSSYVLFTAGAALVALSVSFWLIEARGLRGWARPAIAIGTNSILLYVGSEFLAATLGRVMRFGNPPVAASEWLYAHAFLPWAAPINASLAYACANVLFWCLVAEILYRRRLFLKV